MMKVAAFILLMASTTLAASDQSWRFVEPESCEFFIDELENSEQRTLNARLELVPSSVNGGRPFDARLTVILNDEVLQKKTFHSLDSVWDGHETRLVI